MCVANIRVALPAVGVPANNERTSEATISWGVGGCAASGGALASSPSSPTKLISSARDGQQQALPPLPAPATPPASLCVQPYHLAMLYRRGESTRSLGSNVSSAARNQLVAGGGTADLAASSGKDRRGGGARAGARGAGAAPGQGDDDVVEGGDAVVPPGAASGDAYRGRGLLRERFAGSRRATTPLALPHPHASCAHCVGGLAGKTSVVGAMGKSASAPALGHILRSTWVPRQPRSLSASSRVADDAAAVRGTRAGGQRKGAGHDGQARPGTAA